MSRSRKEPKFLQLFRIAATPCEIKDDFEKLLAGVSEAQGDGEKDLLQAAAGLPHTRRLRRTPVELSEFTGRSTPKRSTAGRKRRFADEGPSDPAPSRKAPKRGVFSHKPTIDSKPNPVGADVKEAGRTAPVSVHEEIGDTGKLDSGLLGGGDERNLVMEIHKTENQAYKAKRSSGGQPLQQSMPLVPTPKGVAPILAAKDVPATTAIGNGLRSE